jgi:transcriptional regulator with XRE-family HTH domain
VRDEGDFDQARIDKALGGKIRGFRRQAGLSREQFAKELNVSPQNVTQIERGQRSRTIPQLRKIASVLGLSTDAFELDELGDPHELHVTGAGKARAGSSGSAKKISGQEPPR